MTTTLLVTGGAGFIGSNFVRFTLNQRDDLDIINLDKLTYAGNPENLADLADHPRYRFVQGDICDAELVDQLMAEADICVHFAAESHVDRSIQDSRPFTQTNVLGTHTLLDAAVRRGLDRFVHVSTDEVYGTLPLDDPSIKFTETTPYQPNSPYAASKAASDLMARAYHHTHALDVVTTNCSNNFGPYQFPEKVIPLFVTNLIDGKKVPLYGDGRNVRDWLHVEDHCEAILAVMDRGRPGETYNIGGDNERSNLELTHMILDLMNAGEEMIQYVQDRKGHDRRYAIDATKIKQELNWRPTRSQWPQGLQQTIHWYQKHENWWRRIQTGEYRQATESSQARVSG